MDFSKRQFLQQLGVLTAGASLIPVAEAGLTLAPTRREGDASRRYAMLIDLRRCVGCQACTVSCAIENQTPHGEFRTTVNQYQVSLEGEAIATNVLLPRLCNHCDNPPCVPVCPVQATFQREDGIVVIDNTLRGVCLLRASLPVRCPLYQSRHPNGGQMYLLRTPAGGGIVAGVRGVVRGRGADHR